MTKRVLGVVLLAPFLALTQPASATAQTSFSLTIGLPGFGAAVSIPAGYYTLPAYVPPPVYAPVPVYAPAPVYVAPAFYGAYYGPRRAYVPVYRPYHVRPYHGRGWAAHGHRR
jgi:hypothetical protein